MRIKHSLFGAAFLLVGIAHSALAVDGVIEINQTKALAGGVTASDTAGFPVVIDTAGSYRLTSDLTVPDVSTTAIRVDADNVSIDLNGFSIVGPATCTPNLSGAYLVSVDCTPTGGFAAGINALAGDQVRVFNGTIVGLGGLGINMKTGSVEDLLISHTGGGVATSGAATISNVRVENTSGGGIKAAAQSIISGCSAIDNEGNGIRALDASLVSGSNAFRNGLDGIQMSGLGGMVFDNRASYNASSGIWSNGSSRVSGNLSHANKQYGLEHGGTIGQTSYSDNVFTGNVLGEVFGATFLIEFGSNVCGTNTTCP